MHIMNFANLIRGHPLNLTIRQESGANWIDLVDRKAIEISLTSFSNPPVSTSSNKISESMQEIRRYLASAAARLGYVDSDARMTERYVGLNPTSEHAKERASQLSDIIASFVVWETERDFDKAAVQGTEFEGTRRDFYMCSSGDGMLRCLAKIERFIPETQS